MTLRIESWLAGVVELIRRPRSTRFQVVAGLVGVVLLLVGAIAAWAALPNGTSLTWWPIVVLILVGTPWGMLLLVVEVDLTGRVAGVQLPRREQARIALIGTALNLLPIPGAAIARLDGIVAAGAPIGSATLAILAVGVIWIAASVLFAGLALVGLSWLAAVFLLAGAAAVAIVYVLSRRLAASATSSDLAKVIVLEAVITLSSAARLGLALAALDVSVPVRPVLAMAASAALSSAIGIAPGGLGIREGLATLFGGVAGIAASIALLAALIDRAAAVVGALIASVVAFPVLHLRAPSAADAERLSQRLDESVDDPTPVED